ncbi:MAG: aldo/keto reductase [Planctomycetes bacterium]|nr:aldo/keto reductase [Planctomycetota bacterium]
MQYKILGRTNMKVSVIGYGASPLGNEFGQIEEAEGVRAVHCAIDNGINYFDVSPYYGRTLAETRLGKALEGKRDKIFLATKCGRYGPELESCDYSAARVTASIDESLLRLRTDYVDLLQIHDIEYVADPDTIVHETIPALHKLREKGKVRFVGITGLPLKMLRYVASCAQVDTILTFCRFNLMVSDLDDVLTPLCREKNIGLINGSPLHMRILTEKGPPPWHPAGQNILEAAREVVAACKQAGADVADVALRFCLDHPFVSTTLVGMSKLRHVQANLKVLEMENNPELLRQIEAIIKPVKNLMWMQGRPENNDQNWRERP